MLLQQRVNNIFKRLTWSFSAETTKCNFLVFASFVLLKLKFDSLKLKSNFFQSDRKYDFFTISVINVQCSNMKRRIKCFVKWLLQLKAALVDFVLTIVKALFYSKSTNLGMSWLILLILSK